MINASSCFQKWILEIQDWKFLFFWEFTFVTYFLRESLLFRVLDYQLVLNVWIRLSIPNKAGICICKIGMSYYGNRFANYPQIVSFLLAPSGFQTVQVFVGNSFSFFSSVQSTWRHLPVPFDNDFHWTHILCRTHWRAPQLIILPRARSSKITEYFISAEKNSISSRARVRLQKWKIRLKLKFFLIVKQ